MKKYFAAVALLLGLTACGGGLKMPLEGTTWKLASMEGIPAAAIESEADAFVVEFNATDTMAFGRTNCNRFFGKYVVEGDKLRLENVGMTRMACPDMQYEDMFVKMLDQTNAYQIVGEELTLLEGAKKLAVFRALPKAAEQPAQ